MKNNEEVKNNNNNSDSQKEKELNKNTKKTQNKKKKKLKKKKLKQKLVVKDKNNQEMNIMNNNLIKILNKDNFTEQDYKVVLDSIIDNNFNELKLFLFDKLDRFEDCLKLFLSDDLNISEHRDIKVFKWIQEKYDMFKDNKGKYKILIQTLEEHTLDLATLSIEKFFELSKLVFKQNNNSEVNNK